MSNQHFNIALEIQSFEIERDKTTILGLFCSESNSKSKEHRNQSKKTTLRFELNIERDVEIWTSDTFEVFNQRAVAD